VDSAAANAGGALSWERAQQRATNSTARARASAELNRTLCPTSRSTVRSRV
jgi:hypothetical protein